MINLSVFGSTGYIGSNYCRMYPDQIFIPRDSRKGINASNHRPLNKRYNSTRNKDVSITNRMLTFCFEFILQS